ncbi:MAG TPA: hypothetical protein VGO57_14780 [Verrucomicrobiae bacterium]|jgi:hypothetical protein
MKIFKNVPAWAAALAVLLSANLACLIWGRHYPVDFNSVNKHFKFDTFYTNGATGYVIQDAKTGKSLLINWDFGDGEQPGEVSYFFAGTNILNVYLKNNRAPRYRFIFHGLEKSEIWWLNEGGASSFTERVTYNTNGDRSNFEIWYENGWYPVDRRNGHNGIIINGQWRPLAFDANGMYGDHANFDIWLENSWYPVTRQNKQDGIVIKGEWHPITFDTNGAWMVGTSTNMAKATFQSMGKERE